MAGRHQGIIGRWSLELFISPHPWGVGGKPKIVAKRDPSVSNSAWESIFQMNVDFPPRSAGPAWSSLTQDLHGSGRHGSGIRTVPSPGPWRASRLDCAVWTIVFGWPQLGLISSLRFPSGSRYSQSHLGWHFWKFKAQSSNVSFATFQWKETFELWAFSFETAFENVTLSEIGCTFWARERGWELKGQERKKKDFWTACQVNHDLAGRFCCCWCSTLFNYNRYSFIGAFFDLIEWLKVWFIDLYLYLISWLSTISRFWICRFWFFIIFVGRNIFLGPQCPTCTLILQN